MPFQQQISDDEILSQFEIQAEKRGRKLFSAAELAEELDVTDEAVRQRLLKMEGDKVEKEDLSGTAYWYRAGEQVFVKQSGPILSVSHWRGKRVHPMDAPRRHAINNLRWFLYGAALTVLSAGLWLLFGNDVSAFLFLSIGVFTLIAGVGLLILQRDAPGSGILRKIGVLIEKWHQRQNGDD